MMIDTIRNNFDPIKLRPGVPFVPPAPRTLAGRYVERRYHVAPVLADLLAFACGLGGGDR